jgi:hypothetical protein
MPNKSDHLLGATHTQRNSPRAPHRLNNPMSTRLEEQMQMQLPRTSAHSLSNLPDATNTTPRRTLRRMDHREQVSARIRNTLGETDEADETLSVDMFSAKAYSRPSSPATFLTTSRRRKGAKSLRQIRQSQPRSLASPQPTEHAGFSEADEARVAMLLRALAVGERDESTDKISNDLFNMASGRSDDESEAKETYGAFDLPGSSTSRASDSPGQESFAGFESDASDGGGVECDDILRGYVHSKETEER